MIRNEIKKILSKRKTWIAALTLLGFLLFIYHGQAEQPVGYLPRSVQIEKAEQIISQANLEIDLAYAKLLQTEEEHVKMEWQSRLDEARGRIEESRMRLEELRGFESDQAYLAFLKTQYLQSLTAMAAQEKDPMMHQIITQNMITQATPPALVRQPNPFSLLMEISGSVLSLITLILVGLLGGDIMSGEKSPATMKNVLSLPLGREKIAFVKFIALFLCILMVFLGTELLVIFISGLQNGWVDPGYSFLIGGAYTFQDGMYSMFEGSAVKVSVLTYLLHFLWSQVLCLFACTAMVFMLSSFAESALLSSGIPIGLGIIWFIVARIQVSPTVLPYIFLSYQNPLVNFFPPGTFIESFSGRAWQPGGIYWGWLCLLITGMVCLLSAVAFFRKEDLYL